jgi:hypothetical protein
VKQVVASERENDTEDEVFDISDDVPDPGYTRTGYTFYF